MRRYLYIGIGGFLGAILRYFFKNLQVIQLSSKFHFNTLVINIIGCFLIAFILRLALDIWDMDPELRLGISAGFVGAFTTFSTLCKEYTVILFGGDVLFSLIYLLLSVSLGLFSVYLGNATAKIIIIAKKY